MSYQQDGLIEASDYNGLVGPSTNAGANTLNATWNDGSLDNAGYKQGAISNVAVAEEVSASEWATLVNTTSSIAVHQGTTITPVTAPVAGSLVTHEAAIPTNLQLIYSNRLNAASQGASQNTTVTRPSGWLNSITQNHVATWANVNAVQAFFNAGGQLKLTCNHPTGGSPRDAVVRNLAANVGTVNISSPSTGTVTIVGTSFNGVTKTGGGGSTPTVNQNRGYYGMNATPTQFFEQSSSNTGPYGGTFIRMSSSAGTANVSLSTVWDLVPNEQVNLLSGTNTTLVVQYPETTNLGNTWGTVTVTTSQSGS